MKTLLLTGLLILPGWAAAEPMTVEFSGTVTVTRGIQEFGPGAVLSGYYIFDPQVPAPGPAGPATGEPDPLIEASISVSGNVYVVDRGVVIPSGGPSAAAYRVMGGPPVAGADLSGLSPYQLLIDPDSTYLESLEDDPLATPPAGPQPAGDVDGWISFRGSDPDQEGMVGFSVDRLFPVPGP